MAWALDSVDGAYLAPQSPMLIQGDYLIRFKIRCKVEIPEKNIAFAGQYDALAGGTRMLLYWSRGQNALAIVRDGSFITFSSNSAPYDADWHEIEFARTSGQVTASFDGQSTGIESADGDFYIDLLTAGSPFGSGIGISEDYQLQEVLVQTSTVDHFWSADASDHSSTALSDTTGGNDAAFVGMGVEAWVDLGGGETVTTEIVDSWSVFEAVNTGLLDSWSVFATVSTSLTDDWPIYNAASNALADAWTIQGAISSFLADEWSVFNSVSVGISDNWTIGGATSATLSDSWTVYNITGSALTDEWSLLASVSAPIADEWAIYTTVNTELADQWDIGGLINAVLTDSWRIGVIVPSRNYTFSLTPRKLSGKLTSREI